MRGGQEVGVFSYNQEALKNLHIDDAALLDRLIEGESARMAHLKKSRNKIDKRTSLREAVAEFVSDGDILYDSGFAYVRTCHQAYFEIMRQGKRGLQALGAPNTNQSYMINFGSVTFSHNSYIGAEMRGTDRNYSRQLQEGKVTILSEWSHGGVAQGLKAAQLGAPGLYSKQMLGSDIVKYNPYTKVMQNPMRDDPDPVLFIPALYPDVVFIHVHAADKYGNAYIYGPVVNDAAVAAVSRKVIITAEEIVPEITLRYNKGGVVIPFIYADAVVELPFGAVPGNMPGCYYWARQWWEKLLRYGSTTEERFREFYDEWIMNIEDQFAFVEKLGGAKWIAEARRQTKAAEGENEDIDFSYQEYTPDNDTGRYY